MNCLKNCALRYLESYSDDLKEAPDKAGTPLDIIESQIRPLDLILFRGDDIVSRVILDIEKTILGNDDWSHCGIILTTDIVNIKNGVPGELYIWESTFDLIKDVELNDYIFGVQVRRLKDVVKMYNKPRDTRVGWCKLKNNPLYGSDKIRIIAELQALYLQYNHSGYEYNPYELCSAVCPFCNRGCCRCLKCLFNCWCGCLQWGCKVTNSKVKPRLGLGNKSFVNAYQNIDLNHRKQVSEVDSDIYTRLFCSELVALIYIKLGIFPEHTIPSHIAPVEFLGHTNEVYLPVVVEDPILLI